MKNPLPNTLYHSRLKPRRPDIRGDYFRDQTAIIHSSPFRRLKHKTQVFFSPKNDHICTRIEHVLHVSTIATTLCKGLGLDVELAQAIALGHDLGHAPFGHIGELVLNQLSRSIGGFIHEVHGLRVVDKITRNGHGLNLTYAVRDGIVSHCGEHFQKSIAPQKKEKTLESISARQTAPLTYEGCAVRVADKVAYLGRDIEDAITAGMIRSRDVPDVIRKSLGNTNGEIIDTLVMDVIRTSAGTDAVSFSDEKYDLICQLKKFNYKRIYNHEQIKKSDKSVRSLIEVLYGHLLMGYQNLEYDYHAYKNSDYQVDRDFGKFISNRTGFYQKERYPERCVVDFVAGMTDIYALESANELLFPRPVDRR
ncbi:HD domain-containing protein [bacterium]|nr:HD domain-containing protein [bacterium]